jgi:VWFA-related protein
MRRLSILGLLALLTFPLWAAKRLSVAQLEQTLISATAAHKADTEIAHQVREIEVTERISTATLERLSNQVVKGPRTALALQLLADTSSFLHLPDNELPAIPAPVEAEQQQQLEAARKYAFGMLPRLPNLLATRTTYSFDDSPQQQEKGGWQERAGLHLVGTSKAEVSVISERENLPVEQTASLHAQDGLVTWGEFGSALLLILNDSAHGTITWSHWEQTPTGPISVFDYAVPKSASHYQVTTPVEEAQSSGGSSRWRISGGAGDEFSASKVLRSRPAYHGSLWIDPASGTILRVSLVADLKGNPTLENGAVLVEYGPVHINGNTFFCPVRSLALSSAPGNVEATLKGAATKWLNENLFADYHLFASTARILTDRADSSPPDVPAKAVDSNAGAVAAPQPEQQMPAATPSAHSAEGTSGATQAQVVDQPPASAGATVETPQIRTPDLTADIPTATKSATAPAPSTRSASSDVPAAHPPPFTAETQTPEPNAATLRLNVNAVLVPVVVRDGHGHTVGDLQKQDFEVFDDSKPRPFSGFVVERHGLPPKSPSSPGAKTPDLAGAGVANSPSGVAPEMALPDRITVFVFDDQNLSPEDIVRVKMATSKTFDGALTGSDMAAVVSTSGKVNSGLTRNRAELADAINALRPNDVLRSGSADCPNIGYYQADLIVNKHDEDALQDVVKQIIWVCNPNVPSNLARGMAESAARHAVTLGQQNVLRTYAAMSEFVRRMAKLPGQHLMILVSSGFLPLEQGARYEESKLMNLAADANVTINALDARGLYTTSLTASDDIQNREPRQVSEYKESQLKAGENAMGELAYATGGNFFHNSNDLESGFRALLDGPETVYLLELSLDGVKPDGAYHRLSIKINRADVRVQARQGYLAPRG